MIRAVRNGGWRAYAMFVALTASAEAALNWDALERRYDAQPGETEAEFRFVATNDGAAPVEIRSVATSCSCTVGAMPRRPWVIAPGASETLRVVVDLRSRRGGLTKTVYVDTTEGEQLLLVHVQVPPPPAVQREMNLMTAQADRQAVLKGDCARCHVEPAMGKLGEELFVAACQICHGAEHRATMVPDLAKPKVARDGAYWEFWIRNGGEGTLMPAFGQAHGGPLDDAQVASLVKYLVEHLPAGPVED